MAFFAMNISRKSDDGDTHIKSQCASGLTTYALRTSQFANQFNQSLQKSYLGGANKNGFYEHRNLRTAFMAPSRVYLC